MERWEIKQRLETLEPEEQKKFLKGLIEDLNVVKAKAFKEHFIDKWWRVLGAGGFITYFGLAIASYTVPGLSQATANTMQGISLGGLGTFFGSLFASFSPLADADEEIMNAADNAKYKIKELKKELKKIENNDKKR